MPLWRVPNSEDVAVAGFGRDAAVLHFHWSRCGRANCRRRRSRLG
jgi:hypothetical protein